MKKAGIWKFLLFLGVLPFIFPMFVNLITTDLLPTMDWLVRYAYRFWPTYGVGAALMAVSAYQLSKLKGQDGDKEETQRS